MKTYYIGAATDIFNAQYALLIESSDTLSIDDIDTYTEDYITNKYIYAMFSKNSPYSDDLLYSNIDGLDLKGNYIIYYTYFGKPLGFTDLQYIIDIKELRLKSIRLKLDFTIINDNVIPQLIQDYSEHQVLTSNHQSHKSILNSIGNSKLDLTNLGQGMNIFSKNLCDLNLSEFNDGSKLYHYSGNLIIKSSNVTKSAIVNPFEIDGVDPVDILSIFDIKLDIETRNLRSYNVVAYRFKSGIKFILRTEGYDDLYRYIDLRGLNIMTMAEHYAVESNFIMLYELYQKANDKLYKYYLINTKSLLESSNPELNLIKLESNAVINKSGTHYVNLFDWRFAIDTDTDRLHLYYIQSRKSELGICSQLMKSKIEIFKYNSNVNDYPIILFGSGYMIQYDILNKQYIYYCDRIPQGIIIKGYSKLYPINCESLFLWKSIIKDIDDSDLCIFQSTEPNKIINLGHKGTHRNLHYINRVREFNQRELKIIRLSHKGCLYTLDNGLRII